MKKIIIDAGHGGQDSGSIGVFGDREARINLVTARLLVQRLKKYGTFEVKYTRWHDEEVSLGKRLTSVREERPDAFVSIHCNAFHKATAHGFEVIYADKYDVPLADAITNSFHEGFPNMRNRGMKNDQEWLGHKLAVLKDLHTPCALVEMGFITNESDYMNVILHDKMAETIERGLLRFFLDEIYEETVGHPV